MTPVTFTTTLNLGVLGEVDVQVSGHYTPGTPDVWYLSNGDPGYPGDPPEFELDQVLATPATGAKVDITSLVDIEEFYDDWLFRASVAYEGDLEAALEDRSCEE